MQKSTTSVCLRFAAALVLTLASFVLPKPAETQTASTVPTFSIVPEWPKPLPDFWVTGAIGGVCVGQKGHVFVLNRRDLTDNELDAARQAPPVLEFDPDGNLINSFGDPEVVPHVLHGCTVDFANNIWMGGGRD